MAISRVVAAVLVLGEVLVIVFEGDAAGVAVDVISDVTMEWWGLELKRRGWGLGWGGLDQLSSVCHHL